MLIAMRDSQAACGTIGLDHRWVRVGGTDVTTAIREPRDIHEDIDPPEFRIRRRDHARHLCRIGKVGLNENRPRARIAQ